MNPEIQRSCDYSLFKKQRENASDRGIEFNFTFEEWIQWWESSLGGEWRTLRGTKSHQYCMARIGDSGPYRIGNVKCITVKENCREVRGSARKKSNLSEADVIYIRSTIESTTDLMQKFKLSRSTLNAIKSRRSWCHIS